LVRHSRESGNPGANDLTGTPCPSQGQALDPRFRGGDGAEAAFGLPDQPAGTAENSEGTARAFAVFSASGWLPFLHFRQKPGRGWL